jgi:hypothetical protein
MVCIFLLLNHAARRVLAGESRSIGALFPFSTKNPLHLGSGEAFFDCLKLF